MKGALTYIHIIAGGLSLITPVLVLLLKKGTKRHVLIGNVFFVNMLIVALSGIGLAVVTNTIFLIAIGVFTVYMLVLGKLAFKLNLHWVRHIFTVFFTLLTAVVLLLIYVSIKLIILGSIFSTVTIAFTLGISIMLRSDIRFYRLGGSKKTFHLTKMLGATISAYTAFLVVNLGQYSIVVAWLAPSIIGTLLIIYWVKKMSKLKPSV